MTVNQLTYLRYLEDKRANQAREAEAYRSNVAGEFETHRANVAREEFNLRSLQEQERSNLAREAETERSNRTKERETHRSNLRNEYFQERLTDARVLESKASAALTRAKTDSEVLSQYDDRINRLGDASALNQYWDEHRVAHSDQATMIHKFYSNLLGQDVANVVPVAKLFAK